MNPIERGVRGVDRWQQRHHVPGLMVGVVKKFGDDRASVLALMLAYYGFMALFPLMLALTTILGFVGNRHLANSVVGSTLKQFPVFGQQIGQDTSHPLTGNVFALVVGLLGLLYGALGVTQASQHAMAQVWNVPGVVRPGFPVRMVRGLLVLVTLGVGMALSAGVSGLVTVTGHTAPFRVGFVVAEVLIDVGLAVVLFRVLTPRSVSTRALLFGAIGAGVGYSVLLTLGTALVQHQLRHAQPVYGPFALVLGLVGWLYLVAQVILYSAEANVVVMRHLWPRSIVQPPLTEADKRVLHDIAKQELRRPEQRVGVGFEPNAELEVALDASRGIPKA
jgi:uncharacterized BrkB/YihY/UPF0761 family membrane protein